MAKKTLTAEEKEIIEARKELWRRGNLTWKLDSIQKQVYTFLKENTKKTSTLVLPRRIGKTFVLTIYAIEQAIQKEKSIIKFLQPEKIMIRTNLRPIMDKILEDCPATLRPIYKTQDSIYLFTNGSEIQLAGTDNGSHEKLRGSDADLCIIDEAGFVKGDLEYIIRSILLPSTLLTEGKIILSSTPPKESEHSFEKYRQMAALEDTLFFMNINDALKISMMETNPRLTPVLVEEFKREYPGGETNDDYRREMLCETIVDGDNYVVPEFNKEVEEECVKEWPRPAFYDKYVGMDIGFKDFTALVFGYYDFEHGVVVIEDELEMNGPKMTLPALGKEILNKERSLWYEPATGEHIAPYLRISDNNAPIVLNELFKIHGILFLPSPKDNKEAAINEVRNLIGNFQIIIHPRCKNLIHQLKHATWNNKRTSFNRSANSGHYDLVDALIYFVRNIDKNKNPYPPGYKFRGLGGPGNLFFNNSKQITNEKYNSFKRLFNIKPK